MADYTIDPAAVVYASTGGLDGVAGEDLIAGQLVFVDTGNGNKLYKADNNVSLLKAGVAGICVNSAKANQPIKYVTQIDVLEVGAIFGGAGKALYLSATAGKMCAESDIPSGGYMTLMGFTLSASTFKLFVVKTGIQVP